MNIAFLPNLAGPDGIMILIIILLLFGAKKLPELAKGMGQAVREFSKVGCASGRGTIRAR